MDRGLQRICLISFLGLSAASASAQTPPKPLTPVDQGIEDLGPLSESFRDMQVDLRSPLGFTNVYRVPGREDQFMRGSGGLFAVFPKSQYVLTRRGVLAEIPAGTVFHIGLPPAPPPPAPETSLARDQRVQHQRDPRVDQFVASAIANEVALLRDREIGEEPDKSSSVAVAPAVAADPPSVATVANNDVFRAQRIQELLKRAAAAHVARAQSP